LAVIKVNSAALLSHRVSLNFSQHLVNCILLTAKNVDIVQCYSAVTLFIHLIIRTSADLLCLMSDVNRRTGRQTFGTTNSCSWRRSSCSTIGRVHCSSW